MDAILQAALETAVEVLLPIVLGLVVVYLRQVTQEVKARMTAEQLRIAESVVASFVAAAEQSGLVEAIRNEGAIKKEWAISQIEAELAARGVNLDVRTISAMIEAEVYRQFTQYKTLPVEGEG